VTSKRHKKTQGPPTGPSSPPPKYEQWVWWPNAPGRRSASQEEFLKLPPRARGELVDRMVRFVEGRTRFKDVDDLGGGIKELRVRLGNNHFRVLFFIDGRTPVALTCFCKNQQATPPTDLNRATRRMKSY